MTDIIESVPKEINAQQLPAQLVEQARAEGVDLVGPGGLLTGLTQDCVGNGVGSRDG